MEAEKIAKRAAGAGFDWENVEQVLDKLREELAELDAARAASDPSSMEDEVGDLLFVIVNIARFLKVDPEQALRRTNTTLPLSHVETGVEAQGKKPLRSRYSGNGTPVARGQKAGAETMSALDGQVILITGAAKRIGRGIALRLAKEGARVAIHYSGSEAEARATAKECGDAPIFRANLEHVAEIEKLFEDVDRHFGRIDALVNNAAASPASTPSKSPKPIGTTSTPST